MISLLELEFKLEFRQKASLASILLFAVGTVYIFSLAFGEVNPRLWNAIFWVVILLGAVNGLSQSFSRQLNYRYNYYHQLASPLSLYAAKVLFNTVFLISIGMMIWGLMALFFGNPVKDQLLFVTTLVMCSLGLSLILTFLSLVSGRINGSNVMAVLAFPVTLPLLLTVVKLGAVSLRLIQQTSTQKDVFMLLGIDLLAVGLAIFLVPTLWREA